MGCHRRRRKGRRVAEHVTPLGREAVVVVDALGNAGLLGLISGSIAAVNDVEIVEGIKLLAETEGVFTETAGGTTIAVLKKLVEQGKINPDETTVAYITGNGLKTTEAVVDAIGKPYTIEAQLDSFNAAWQQAQAAHVAS